MYQNEKKNELTWNVKFNDRSEISLGILRPYENIFLILFYSHDNRQSTQLRAFKNSLK